MRPPVNPGTVTWAGDHLLLSLRAEGTETETTYVSYYRTLYSAMGAGHTALVISDVGEGVRAIYTDNPRLTEWVRENLARRPGHPFRDRSVPVHEARFEQSGGVGQELRDTIRVEGSDEIAMAWSDFEAPFYLEAPQGVIGGNYDIFSLICPARQGTLEVNGQAASGEPYLNETWTKSTGQPRSSVLVALCEVLVDLPT
jgi:hypothetical protein